MVVSFLSVAEMVDAVALRIVFQIRLIPETISFPEFPLLLSEARLPAAVASLSGFLPGWALALRGVLDFKAGRDVGCTGLETALA